jgi:RNA polymerase sigma-70 factor (ECF subfamily)
MSPPESNEARWFAEEVHAHEPSLRAYLRGTFPKVRDIDDIVQESYLRVWRARLGRPIRSARAFLFKVARHVALDGVRRSAINPVDSMGDLSALPVVEDRPGILATLSRAEKVRLLAAAIETLPPRCREVVVLRKLECLPQKQVAARLGIVEKTVENHLAHGERLCADYLRGHGVHSLYRDEGR